MLRLALCALVLALLGAIASADPVRALEQTSARLGRTRMAESQVPLVEHRGFTVWVRPGSRTIGVSGTGFLGLGQRGFALDAQGRLPLRDRRALNALLSRHAPGTTAQSIRRAAAGAIRAFTEREALLRGQDGVVDGILAKARAATGTKDAVLWEGRRGRIVYRPGSHALVGEAGLSQHGFFLDDPSSMSELRRFLLERQ